MEIITNTAFWSAIAFVFITPAIIKMASGRITLQPRCEGPLPPVVDGFSLIGLIFTLLTKGLRAMIYKLQNRFGSVFTISFLRWKITFLVGHELSSHFYQGLDSEISHGNILEFTVPMFGKGVGYGVDITTRNEQMRFCQDALKPSKCRSHIYPMVEEVEDYFAKWGQQGTIDLKQELEHILLLISGRCLIGKEVREMMFNNFFTQFHELTKNGVSLTSVLFPHAPTPANRRRDRARQKLSEMFAEVLRLRKSSNSKFEEDVMQNMINSRYKNGRPTTEAEVIGMILSLLFAGKHSSSAGSSWTGAHLLSNERLLTAALEEQGKIISKYGNHIDYNSLLEMDVLHRCIKEALRMHPPSAASFRMVHKNFTVRTKEGYEYEIPRGHMVASPVLFNNNMSCIYKDPDVYDPDRFGPGRDEDRVAGKFSYTSFGGGRHACIGETLAYVQIKVIWTHLLRNFKLQLVSSFPETDWSKFVLEPKGKIVVSYERKKLPTI